MPAAPPAPARAARRPPGRWRGAGAATSTSSSATTRPGRGERTATRSASRTASSTSWVTSRTVRGSRASAPASHACMSARDIASSAPKGSSRHSTGAPASSVRRKATRWRMPAESSWGRAASKPPRPNASNSGAARRRASSFATPVTRSASPALSSALSHGRSRSRWGMSTARPASTVPASGASSPQTSSSSVVLPQPLGPTTASTSPGAASSVTPSSASTRPNALRTPSRRTPRAPLPCSGVAGADAVVVSIAPFAGITPTGSRVSAGTRRYLSRPLLPAPLVARHGAYS